MGKQPQDNPPVVVRDFGGLNSNSDAADIDAGQARRQVNVAASKPGLLQVRPGWQRVRFED